MKNLISSIIVFTSLSLQAADFNFKFKVINLNGVSATDEQKVRDGVQFFTKIVKENCNININAVVETKSLNSNITFEYSDSWIPLPIGNLGSFYFRFYQKNLYELTTQNKLSQEPNAVTLFVTNGLSRHCGFAFPDIQLTDLQSQEKNPKANINRLVLPWIRNRVILGSASSNTLDCANSSRLVAHELAHVFVQDNPPHLCWDNDVKKNISCEDNNILATQRRIYPPRNGGGRIGFPNPPGDFQGPDEPIILPAIGTKITEIQCRAIAETLVKNTHKF